MPTLNVANIQATLKQVVANHVVPTPPTITQMVDSFFKALDTNANGAVSLLEVSALLPKNAPMATLVAGLVFSSFDANHNGSITRAELTTWADARDANHDGTLQPMELKDDLVHLIGVVFPHGLPGLPGGHA